MTDTPDVSKKFEVYVEAYVKIRDKIKEANEAFAESIKADVETQNLLTAWLTKNLEVVGAESVRTSAGTVYTTTRYSASLADPQAFMEYVIKNSAWELLDRRANSTAVRDHVETKGALPPGTNLSALRTVGVRRAAGT